MRHHKSNIGGKMPKIKKNGKKKSSNVIPIKRDIIEAENGTDPLDSDTDGKYVMKLMSLLKSVK